jgi:predicted nucleic acid-binding Zn ribbon protein
MKLRRRREPSPEWSAVGDFVKASLKKLGVSQAVRRVGLDDEVRGWVGESGAKYLSRVTAKNGVVSIQLSHPAWMQEVASRKMDLLKMVQERFPDLKIRDAKVILAKSGSSSNR